MKIRIKFLKQGSMKFVGHLDMMRYFQKAMRRADIDIAYSEGFSPHQIMSFAAPLGTGLTSGGEYLDIEVHSVKSSEEARKALNEVMADGVTVTEFKLLPEGTKNAMSSVAAADYLVFFKDPSKNPFGGGILAAEEAEEAVEAEAKDPESESPLSKAIYGFLNSQEQICITKQTKKSEKVMDLKPLIYDLKAVEEGGSNAALHSDKGLSVNVDLNPNQSLNMNTNRNPNAGWNPNLNPNLNLNLNLNMNLNLNLNLNRNPAFFLKLCTGSTDNVKPELVLQAFFDYCRKQGICSYEFHPLEVQIHRLEVYTRNDKGTFVPLGAMGQEITTGFCM